MSGRYNSEVYAISIGADRERGRRPCPHGGDEVELLTGLNGLLWSTGLRRLTLVLALLTVAVLTVGAAAWVASPTPSALAARVEARLRGSTERPVGVGAIPAILREAVVATEDERLYRHRGIDMMGVIRALPYDLTHLSFAQGASTITEQVAKVLYLGGNDHSPWRKLEDAAVAWKLESRYRKAQILVAYLNTPTSASTPTGSRRRASATSASRRGGSTLRRQPCLPA
jgi:Transglycosylase